jgi:hypothetical protein
MIASLAERRRASRHPDASDVFIIVHDSYTVLNYCQGRRVPVLYGLVTLLRRQ